MKVVKRKSRRVGGEIYARQQVSLANGLKGKIGIADLKPWGESTRGWDALGRSPQPRYGVYEARVNVCGNEGDFECDHLFAGYRPKHASPPNSLQTSSSWLLPAVAFVAERVLPPLPSFGGLEMGFWQTGYMEFHQDTHFYDRFSGWPPEVESPPPPPEYPCNKCGAVLSSEDDLAVHLFDGHPTTRPILILRGRECGRSREVVIEPTCPSDWSVRNASYAEVNGRPVEVDRLGDELSAKRSEVTSVRLFGDNVNQDFDFAFTIADQQQLQSVDHHLDAMIRSRSLSIRDIDQFIVDTRRFDSARPYSDGLADYLFGVLAREDPAGSGLRRTLDDHAAYARKFDESVASLGKYNRPPAEAICGLVAFHYNQFDLALRRTKSPRVSRASLRLASLLAGLTLKDRSAIAGWFSLDYALSDSKTEEVLSWCCIPLDGTAGRDVFEMEKAIPYLEPADQVKMHLIAAEHHLVAGKLGEAKNHVAALMHSRVAEGWVASMKARIEAHP
jgi:hypothetical protein